MSASGVNVSILCIYDARLVCDMCCACVCVNMRVCGRARLWLSPASQVASTHANTYTHFYHLTYFPEHALCLARARAIDARCVEHSCACMYLWQRRRQGTVIVSSSAVGWDRACVFFIRRTKVCVQRSALCYTTLVASKSSEQRSISINWIMQCNENALLLLLLLPEHSSTACWEREKGTTTSVPLSINTNWEWSRHIQTHKTTLTRFVTWSNRVRRLLSPKHNCNAEPSAFMLESVLFKHVIVN